MIELAVVNVAIPRSPPSAGHPGAPAALGTHRLALRVLEPGEVPAAGPVEVVREDAAAISVHDAHLAMADVRRYDPDLSKAVASHPALAA